jgi:hypothetical protein
LARNLNYKTTYNYNPFSPPNQRRYQFDYYVNYLVDGRRAKWPEAVIRMSPEDAAFRISTHYKPNPPPEITFGPVSKKNIIIPSMLLPAGIPFIVDTKITTDDCYVMRVIPIGDIASNTTIFG